MKRRSFFGRGRRGAVPAAGPRARAGGAGPARTSCGSSPRTCRAISATRGRGPSPPRNVDRLAREGTVFEAAHFTCPVCSPSRSALITGMYQTTIGAHNHRSFRGKLKNDLAAPVRPVPELFREAGYYVCNGANPTADALGKTDYNFNLFRRAVRWEGLHGRAPGQPFFIAVPAPRRQEAEREGSQPGVAGRGDAAAVLPRRPGDAAGLGGVFELRAGCGPGGGGDHGRLRADGLAEKHGGLLPHGPRHQPRPGKQFLYEEERGSRSLCGARAACPPGRRGRTSSRT
jgi:hypothetical protein